MLSPQIITREIFDLLEAYGAEEYAGEKISQLEHMYQSAMLAIEEGYDDEVVLAAFLHDIGHLFPVHDASESMVAADGHFYGVTEHEKLGAAWLRRMGFGERLCRLIESHVDAKRYLTFKDPAYYMQLSEASKRTLDFQGGRMEAAEAADFEKDPLFKLFIKMRHWDEAAKVTGIPVMALDVLRVKLEGYLESRYVAY